MLTADIARAAAPNLDWAPRAPGLAAILARALRSDARDRSRT